MCLAPPHFIQQCDSRLNCMLFILVPTSGTLLTRLSRHLGVSGHFLPFVLSGHSRVPFQSSTLGSTFSLLYTILCVGCFLPSWGATVFTIYYSRCKSWWFHFRWSFQLHVCYRDLPYNWNELILFLISSLFQLVDIHSHNAIRIPFSKKGLFWKFSYFEHVDCFFKCLYFHW